MIVPGSLVRPKYNMNVNLWRSYTFSDVKRVTMSGELGFYLTGLAMVVAMPVKDTGRQSQLVALYVPERRRFAYAWREELNEA